DTRVEAVREELGFNDPIVVQYAHWLGDVVHGDLGTSLFTGRTVTSELSERFPVTLSLAVGAVLFAAVFGIPLGIAAAMRPGSLLDRVIGVGASFGIPLPDFFLGPALVVLFAVQRDWLPASRYVDLAVDPVEWARHLLMPWIALGVGG